MGSEFLYEDDVVRALSSFASDSDRESAFQTYVDQWITTALLAEEARNAGLDEDPAVESLVADNERSILASAAVERIYELEVPEPSNRQMVAYYESAKESLTIREDYLRVRHVAVGDPDSATVARRLLQRAMRGGQTDSLWRVIVGRFSSRPSEDAAASETYKPESSLFVELPAVSAALSRLRTGQIAQTVEDDASWHVLQLVDRAAEGTIPEAEWIEEVLHRRVQLQLRKEAYARRVQQLRTEADSRNLISYGAETVVSQ